MKENLECPNIAYWRKLGLSIRWKISLYLSGKMEYRTGWMSLLYRPTQIHLSQSTDCLHVNNLVRIKSYKKKTHVSPEFFITQHLIKQVLSLVISNNSFLCYCRWSFFFLTSEWIMTSCLGNFGLNGRMIFTWIRGPESFRSTIIYSFKRESSFIFVSCPVALAR